MFCFSQIKIKNDTTASSTKIEFATTNMRMGDVSWGISSYPIFSIKHHSYGNLMNCLSSKEYCSPQSRAGVLAAVEGLV